MHTAGVNNYVDYVHGIDCIDTYFYVIHLNVSICLISLGGERHTLGGIRNSSQQAVAIKPQVLSRHVSEHGKHLNVLTTFWVYMSCSC